jgi:hypothetical protein
MAILSKQFEAHPILAAPSLHGGLLLLPLFLIMLKFIQFKLSLPEE